MTPVGARLRAPTGVVIFQIGIRGLSPRPPEGIFLPSLKDKVQKAHPDSARPRRGLWRCRLRHVPDELRVFVKALRRSRDRFEEGVHGFDEELFAVVGDKRQLRKR